MAAPQPTHGHYEFATTLRACRKKAGMTQVEVSEATIGLGHPIRQGLLSQYETGRSGASPKNVVVLERVLQCGHDLSEAVRRDSVRMMDALRGYRRLPGQTAYVTAPAAA